VAIVGFGGYPTVPPVIAASLLRIPSVLHEANGVMGRANRFLARRASLIATGFSDTKGIPPGLSALVVQTGNPIRPSVQDAALIAYKAPQADGTFNLLVTGGSQGARVMSDVVPPAIELLSPELRKRFHVVQQARDEDLERVRALYTRVGVAFEVAPFFDDLPRRIADAHLVIARSGASTVAELAVIGRPSILVPLPGALDQDQAANAKVLGDVGAAIVLPQLEFTPERVAAELRKALGAAEDLTKAAQAAHSASITDAAGRLAEAVLGLVAPHKNGKYS
jgi:UDP-N-acetylglucosamine--N-acetylmuramyl-(pentapeptide) pyrophosphoryl-undecaprenol N-acetylglucosamine transferase